MVDPARSSLACAGWFQAWAVDGKANHDGRMAAPADVMAPDGDGRLAWNSCLLSIRTVYKGISKDRASGFQGCAGFVVGLCWDHIGTDRKEIHITVGLGRRRRRPIITYKRAVFIASGGWTIPFTPISKPWSRRYRYDRWRYAGSRSYYF